MEPTACAISFQPPRSPKKVLESCVLVPGRSRYERSCTTIAPICEALAFREAPPELSGCRRMPEHARILSDQHQKPGPHGKADGGLVESCFHRFGPFRDGCNHSSNIVAAYLADCGPATAMLAHEPFSFIFSRALRQHS